jgi:hypothetical protein
MALIFDKELATDEAYWPLLLCIVQNKSQSKLHECVAQRWILDTRAHQEICRWMEQNMMRLSEPNGLRGTTQPELGISFQTEHVSYVEKETKQIVVKNTNKKLTITIPSKKTQKEKEPETDDDTRSEDTDDDETPRGKRRQTAVTPRSDDRLSPCGAPGRDNVHDRSPTPTMADDEEEKGKKTRQVLVETKDVYFSLDDKKRLLFSLLQQADSWVRRIDKIDQVPIFLRQCVQLWNDDAHYFARSLGRLMRSDKEKDKMLRPRDVVFQELKHQVGAHLDMTYAPAIRQMFDAIVDGEYFLSEPSLTQKVFVVENHEWISKILDKADDIADKEPVEKKSGPLILRQCLTAITIPEFTHRLQQSLFFVEQFKLTEFEAKHPVRHALSVYPLDGNGVLAFDVESDEFQSMVPRASFYWSAWQDCSRTTPVNEMRSYIACTPFTWNTLSAYSLIQAKPWLEEIPSLSTTLIMSTLLPLLGNGHSSTDVSSTLMSQQIWQTLYQRLVRNLLCVALSWVALLRVALSWVALSWVALLRVALLRVALSWVASRPGLWPKTWLRHRPGLWPKTWLGRFVA